MPDTLPHSADYPPAPERRLHARRRIDALCPVTLGRDNGGIVLNLSESGLHIQAVGPLGADARVEMRFALPQSSKLFDATGQVAWMSESKKEAGILLVDVDEDVRTQLREWVAKQSPEEPAAVNAASPRDKDKHVLSMPSARAFRGRGDGFASTSKLNSEEFNSLFPSEKTFLPARPAKSATPTTANTRGANGADAPKPEPKTSLKEWVSGIEQQAKTAKERMPDIFGAPENTQLAAVPTGAEQVPAANGAAPISAAADAVPIAQAAPMMAEPASQSMPAQAESAAARTGKYDDLLAQLASQKTVTSPASTEMAASGAPAAPIGSAETVTADISTTEKNTQSVAERPTPGPMLVEEKPLGVFKVEERQEEKAESAIEISRSDFAQKPEAATTAGETAPGGTEAQPLEPKRPWRESPIRSSEETIAALRASLGRARKPSVEREYRPTESAKPDDAASPAPASAPRVDAPAAFGKGESLIPPAAPEETKSAKAEPATAAPASPTMLRVEPPRVMSGETHPTPKRNVPIAQRFRLATGLNLSQVAMLIIAFAILLGIGLALERQQLYTKPSVEDALAAKAALAKADRLSNAVDALAANSNAAPGANSNAAPRSQSNDAAAKNRRATAAQGSPQLTPRATTSSAANPTAATVTNQSAPEAVQQAQAPAEAAAVTPTQTAAASAPGAPSSQEAPQKTASSEATAKAAPAVSAPAVVPSPAAQPSAGSAITAPGDRVLSPSLLYRVDPVYPGEAVAKHVEGTVKLNAVIGRDGHVMGLGVVSGPALLISSALNAAKEWRFVPALLNGEPVETQTDITIEFHLPTDATR